MRSEESRWAQDAATSSGTGGRSSSQHANIGEAGLPRRRRFGVRGPAKTHGRPAKKPGARSPATASMTSRTPAMLPSPPHWTSSTPPGRRAPASRPRVARGRRPSAALPSRGSRPQADRGQGPAHPGTRPRRGHQASSGRAPPCLPTRQGQHATFWHQPQQSLGHAPSAAAHVKAPSRSCAIPSSRASTSEPQAC